MIGEHRNSATRLEHFERLREHRLEHVYFVVHLDAESLKQLRKLFFLLGGFYELRHHFEKVVGSGKRA